MDFVTIGVSLGLVTNLVCLLLIAILFKDKYFDDAPQPAAPNKIEASRQWYSPEALRSASYSSVLHSMSPARIKRICITGGPCGGKTTALTRITERVRELGQKVFVVPEAATLLMKGGAMINMEDFSRAQKVHFQAKILTLQIILEDVFTDLCQSSLSTCETGLILCDRGVMDGSAYVTDDLWQALLDEYGLNTVHLRDRRYDAVLHMVTAAAGAEQHYNTETNEARYEGLDQAVVVDNLIQKAWTGHPNFTIIDNNFASFDAKLVKSVEQVCISVGLPGPILNYYKFLVVGSIEIPDSLFIQTLYIEETFLQSKDNLIERISRRGQEGSYTYSYSATLKDKRNTVSKNQLSSREFMTLYDKSDPERKTLQRTRKCFIWESQYYALDTFTNVKKGISVLRVETEQHPVIPSFLQIGRDITNDAGYSSYVMSKVDYYVAEADRPLLEE